MSGLIIVIPTFNEADNIEAMSDALLQLGLADLSILYVDDNSPDGTGQIADRLAEQNPDRISVLHRTGKLGLGTAYITGFKWALAHGAEAVCQMDADFSHNPESIPDLLEQSGRTDFVIGSRYVPGGKLDEHWGVGRILLSRFGNGYARTILRMPILDITGGFRIWNRRVLETMPLDRVRSNGYVFQVEMAYVAHRLGFSHYEVPIYFEDRRIGQSKMSFRIQVEAAVRVWQLPFLYRDLRSH
ncbi:MAG: polyprenol monophosphomannose synthase [Anaerolineales bacterium]|nr:polyprenol monophosphomannose synthase [Anaerolineales bacterium]